MAGRVSSAYRDAAWSALEHMDGSGGRELVDHTELAVDMRHIGSPPSVNYSVPSL